MRLSITTKDKIKNPLKGFGYAFIDSEDKKLKIKKHDSIIEFTNDLSNIQLLNLTDYTAFEVFAHDYDIPVGECEELGGYVNVKIAAEMSHDLTLRANEYSDKQSTIIDWGDGVFTELKNETPDGSEGDWRYKLTHTYESNGKYIIKIYGNTYYGIIHGSDSKGDNILCRVFDIDLPVSSHLSNFSSFCRRSTHLLKVDVSKCHLVNRNYINLSNMFIGCTNLIEAIGFSYVNKMNCKYSIMFQGCSNLKYTDFILSSSDVINRIFDGCSVLESDISTLLRYFTITNKTSIDANSLFKGCALITGIVPGDKLWNNKNITWTNTSDVFTGCSDEIRAQAPTSWGGTADDEIIEKSSGEKIAELESIIASLTERITALENA